MAEMRIENIRLALEQRAFPTVTVWNRLEARPRTGNFDRSLKAEVRDPLWMLTRQWQMGEFEGDDAGSPAFAKMHLTASRLNKYQPDRHDVQPFDADVPLEAEVEQRPIPFTIGKQKIALDLRLLMGRQWLKMIRAVGDFAQAYIERYEIEMPDPDEEEDAAICAHGSAWQQVSAVAGRAMDGAALYHYLKEDSAHGAHDGIPGMSAQQQDDMDEIGETFVSWFESLFLQPRSPEQNAWQPEYLEYQFSLAAPEVEEETVLAAEEYYHGRLDWYNLNVDTRRETFGEVEEAQPPELGATTASFIPTQLVFDGMPHSRWWTFEDRRTNFGDIEPGTTDLAKLLLIEFGLVYANDWFLFPLTLPVGTVTEVKGLAITDVFGERFWIEPAGRGASGSWERWSMFTLSRRAEAGTAPEQPADLRFLLLPTVPRIQEGKPWEEVRFIRDEVANMVWGIESTVPLPDGSSNAGYEAALETRNYYERLQGGAGNGESAPTVRAPIRYRVMWHQIPENWIPFIPVHKPNDNREIQLQRAALPRILEGSTEPPQKIRPRTILLREGLDREPAEPYFVHEEEVPDGGAHITQAFQRTRWRQGRTFVWLGVRKQTGRGPGASNLVFDQIVPTGQRAVEESEET